MENKTRPTVIMEKLTLYGNNTFAPPKPWIEITDNAGDAIISFPPRKVYIFQSFAYFLYSSTYMVVFPIISKNIRSRETGS